MQNLSRVAVLSLLEGLGDPVAQAVLAMATDLRSDTIRAARQEPRTWSDTLAVKYSMVRDRGYRVDGLEGLVDALAKSEERYVVGLAMAAGEEFGLVVMDESSQRVIGLLHIAPELGTP